MRRLILILALFAALSCPGAYGWDPLGHRTIAQIAENHLTPAAKAAIMKYVGEPLASIALDADDFRAYWTVDLGFIPTNPDAARLKSLKQFDFSTPLNISPWSHSFTVDANFVPYRTDNLDGAYINNCVYYMTRFAAQLKSGAKSMDPVERYRAIALITHFVGDMHCPMHIVYLPAKTNKGSYKVTYKGKSITMHYVWDSTMPTETGSNYSKFWSMADTFSESEIAAVTQGDLFDWAADSAVSCWYVHNEYSEGDELPSDYVATHQALLYSQIRKAGYRLASLLNEIFQ